MREEVLVVLRGDLPWVGRPFIVVGRADGLFLEDVTLETEEADLRLEFDAIAPPHFFSSGSDKRQNIMS